MFLDISKIGAEGLSLDQTFDRLDLKGMGDEEIVARGVRVRGEGTPGRMGIHLTAQLEATVELPCSRCLDSCQKRLEKNFFLILAPDAVELPAGDEEVPEDHAALFYATEGKVSVADIASEQIYLQLPLKPVCKADCQGLCPECGTNRNTGTCDCGHQALDPRLAPLLQFRDQKSEN